MIPTESEILERLRPLLAEVLGRAPEYIRLEHRLMRDLGAESIDLLDLSFRIEETFGVTIETNEVEREAGRRVPQGAYEQDGVLTSEALTTLAEVLPEVDPAQIRPGLRRSEVPGLLTVGFFVRLIRRKLEQRCEPPTPA